MRKWHRWAGTVLGLFLGVIAITGLILQFFEFQELSEKKEPPAISQIALQDPAAVMAQGVAALTAGTTKQPASIIIESAEGATLVKARLAGETTTRAWHSGTKAISLVIEKRKGPPPPGSGFSLKGLAKGIHTGVIVGIPGVLFGMILGSTLLFFVVSGYILWWRVARQRKKIGQSMLFWK